jgi:hypothetical protein
MPSYEVVSGDTVWGLSRRALTEQLGRVPTNREILEVVNQVQVPSGNVDLIFPGEQITIPVGPGYGGGADGGSGAGGGGTPGQTPNLPGGVRPQPGRPDGGIYTPIDPPYAGGLPGRAPGGSPGGAVNAPAGGRISEQEIAAAAGEQFLDPYAQYRSQIRPAPLGLDQYPESTYLLGGLTAAALAGGGAASLLGRGAVGAANAARPALTSGARPALSSGARPALPAGPAGGYPAAGGGNMPFQFGPTPFRATGPGLLPRPPAPRVPFPAQSSVPAQTIPQFPWGAGFQRYGTGYMG